MLRKVFFTLITGLTLVVGPIVSAEEMGRRMDSGRDHGGMGGMGIGTGIGVGIGIGQAISQQPAAEPEVRRVSKKKVKREKATDTALKFDGKPWYVTHNAAHKDGAIGRKADHKSVLVERDGHYLKRSYYAGTDDADNQKWFWYDKALEDNDPVIPLLPYVVICPEGSDDCTIKEKKSSDPGRLKNHDAVIAGFWEWWNNIAGACAVNAVPEPGSIPATVLVNCTAVGLTTPCNGVCKLYTITGDPETFPKRLPAGNQKAYKCSCESP
jgi:hypothetical protein